MRRAGTHSALSPVGDAGSWRWKNVTHRKGGRMILLLGVDRQVWEPSGKEESLREVANWHRKTVFSNLLSCFSISYATVFSISDSPKSLLSTFPATNTLCCCSKCKRILHGKDSTSWHQGPGSAGQLHVFCKTAATSKAARSNASKHHAGSGR